MVHLYLAAALNKVGQLNMYYDITCVRFAQRSEQNCSPAVTREYETGLLFEYNYKRRLIRSPYKVTTVGRRFFLSDPYGNKIDFGAEETSFTYDELLELIDQCSCCSPFLYVNSSEVEDNGDGTYSIPKILAPDKGDVVFDETFNLYEYNGEAWVLSGDISGLPYVHSIKAGDGMMVDDTNPKEPIVGLNQASKDSLQKADSAIQDTEVTIHDFLKTAYVGTRNADHTVRSPVSNQIQVSNVDTVNNTFETNIEASILENTDFNPIDGTLKWTGWMVGALNPNFLIDSYENGVFTYSTAGVSSPITPTDGDYIQLFNPFINYKNVRSDDLFLIDGIAPGATFDGVTISYITTGVIHKRMDGVYVQLFTITYVGGNRNYRATSTDRINWTVDIPHILDASTAPNGAGAGAPTGVVRVSDNEVIMILTSTRAGRLICSYGRFDDNLNLLEPTLHELPIQGWDYSTDQMRTLSFTRYNGKYRLLVWKMDNQPAALRRTVEVVFDGGIEEIISGTSTNTKTTVHTPGTIPGYLGGWVDMAGYLQINDKLYCLWGISDNSSIGGQFVTYSNRVLTVASLEDGVWVPDVKGPYLMNPIQMGSLNPNYSWQRDHLGGNVCILQENGEIYLYIAANNGADTYNILGIQLTNIPPKISSLYNDLGYVNAAEAAAVAPVQSVTGDGVDDTDPKNLVINIPDQVCSVQYYPTFQDLPVDGKECVLYIADGKYWKFGEEYCIVQEPPNVYDPSFSSFEELPQPGDPAFTYVVELGGGELNLYIWRDGAYQPVYFDGGNYPPEWTEGQYAYTIVPGVGPAIVRACKQYVDVTPDQEIVNLFTDDLTLSEARAHQINTPISFNINSGVGRNGVFFIQDDAVTGNRKVTFQAGNGTITFQTLETPGNIQRGLVLLNDVRLFTGQDLTALNPNTVAHFLKLVSNNGAVQYQPITADDIDDTTSVQKFVSQGEKDDIATAVQPGDLADVATSGEFGDLLNVPDFIEDSERDQPGGFAGVGMDGFIPSLLLPSYVDDVLEFANFASLPTTGESGKIYVTLDDNKTYRWSGSAYVEISQSLALGETSSTAYRGDRGKTAYDHSQVTSGNPHNVTAADVGLGNVDNTSDADKPVSTAQGQAINQAEANANQYTDQEIGNLGTAAQADTGDFATSAQGAKADAAVQLTLPDISPADWVLDEDDMVSDSDTKVPTQQSVKAYVDANAGGAPVNLFTDDLVLGALRTHDLNSLRVLFQNGNIELENGDFKVTDGDLRFTNGSFIGNNLYYILNNSSTSFAVEGSRFAIYTQVTYRAGVEALSDVLYLWDGRDNALYNNKHNVFLKRVNTGSIAEWQALTIPEYASDTAADNDSDLESGAPYYVTGEEVVKVKGLVSGPVAKNLFTEDLTLGASRNHDLGSNLFRLLGSGNAEVEWIIEKQDGSFYSRSRIRQVASLVEVLTENLNNGIKAGFSTRFSQGQEPTLVVYTGQTVTNSNKVNKFLIRKTFNDVEFGNLTIPEYASDTDADNDPDLVSGAPYSLTGDRTVYRKP